MIDLKSSNPEGFVNIYFPPRESMFYKISKSKEAMARAIQNKQLKLGQIDIAAIKIDSKS